MCTTHEYKKTTKGGEEEKNCYLKFKKQKIFFLQWPKVGQGEPSLLFEILNFKSFNSQSELMFLPSSSNQFGKFGVNY